MNNMCRTCLQIPRKKWQRPSGIWNKECIQVCSLFAVTVSLPPANKYHAASYRLQSIADGKIKMHSWDDRISKKWAPFMTYVPFLRTQSSTLRLASPNFNQSYGFKVRALPTESGGNGWWDKAPNVPVISNYTMTSLPYFHAHQTQRIKRLQFWWDRSEFSFPQRSVEQYKSE